MGSSARRAGLRRPGPDPARRDPPGPGPSRPARATPAGCRPAALHAGWPAGAWGSDEVHSRQGRYHWPVSVASPLLHQGARVAVVAPSGAFDPARLERGVERIRAWGLDVVPGEHLHARHRYTAGTIEQRRADLITALTAPDIDAVWFARGGYGTVQLLPDLPPPADDRPIIGFSDATALFCALDRQRLHGVRAGRAVHGPVLHSLADLADPASQQALRSLLLGDPRVHLPGVHLAGPTDRVQGRVVGGNLCVLASLAGTPWALCARDAILLLEDVGEPAYKLDRLITQLRLSGALDGVRGVALGTFTDCRTPPDADWTIEALLVELLAPLGVPVVGRLPVGHGSRNHAFVHGGHGVLTVEGLHVDP
ncbi:MAG: LD-carboxypeptidase [Alphaproteobacteria bacterium]|nr:LD-carboxypeptidase [Alphaproteobacteria bacterium]